MGSPIVGGLANTFSGFPRKVLDYASQMAQPVEHGIEYARTLLGFPPSPETHPDTSWHDQMTRGAVQSFRDAQKPDLSTMKKPLGK